MGASEETINIWGNTLYSMKLIKLCPLGRASMRSIELPSNTGTIKSLIHTIPKPKDCTKTSRLQKWCLHYKDSSFEAIKLVVLQLLEPVSKTLKETSLLISKLLSVCRNGIKVLEQLLHLLNRDGSDAFHHDDIFKTANKILEQI